MKNFKKMIWCIVFFASLFLILANYNALVDFVSRRSYETFAREELTGIFSEACFRDGTEIVLEDEWVVLTRDYPQFTRGKLWMATLTDGRKVLVVSDVRFGEFIVGEPVRGLFADLPNDVEYLTDELEVEPYVFYCFERYLTNKQNAWSKPNIVAFFVGVAGMFVYLCSRLEIFFPGLFAALFKSEGTTSKRQRDSNFELLRIICMIMIIMQHFGFWGEFDITGEITKNTVILQSVVNVGKIGVNCFMMITGYYCAFSTFKPSKITALVGKVWFYTWGIGIILFSAGVGIRSVENLIKTVFPIFSGAFWFITIYIIVYVLSPYINKVVEHTERDKFKILLLFLFVIWSVVPSVVKPGWEFTNTGWMIFMYLIGAYFRKFEDVWADCVAKPVIVFGIAYGILMYLTFMWDDTVKAVVYHQTLAQKHTIPIVVCSVALFVLFKNINIGHNSFINRVAKATFGVYLIHENPVLNDLLWTKWLKVNSFYTSEGFGWYTIGTILLVFVTCTIIDIIVSYMWAFIKLVLKKICYFYCSIKLGGAGYARNE